MKNADMPAMPLSLNPGEFAADGMNVDGLTKREHFAAMAMQGFLANAWQAETLDSLGECSSQQMATVAEASCVMADALLKALEDS